MNRSRRVAKQGWDQAEGVHPTAAALEEGSMSSGRKEEVGTNTEKQEHVGR